MRITGLASGLDMDQIITDSMKPYRMKIDEQKQKKEILEIKQKLYREIIKDSKDFNTKYFSMSSKDNLISSANYTSVKFQSKDDSIVNATGLAGAVKGNYTVDVTEMAKSTSTTVNVSDFTGGEDLKFNYNGKEVIINIKDIDNDKDLAKAMNKQLSEIGLKAAYSDFSKSIVIESKETGTKIGANDNNFTIEVGKVVPPANEGDAPGFTTVKPQIKSTGEGDLIATIENSRGEKIQYGNGGEVSGSNKVVLDGIEFSISSTGKTSVSGKTDVTELKDKLVNFVNDYNKLIEKLNGFVKDKRDKNFMPLTEEQKKAMSESEIKLWNEKVEKGQLTRDQDVSRVINSLKQSMKTLVEGSGLNLEKIGINPVKDYEGKNGTFFIDEAKLTKALEEDTDAIMNMFTAKPKNTPGLTEQQKYNQTGLFYRMNDIFKKEFESSDSPFITKAGVQGSSSFTQNTITKSIEQYERKIKDMEKSLKGREQRLYTQYSKLEVAMNKYNSQQSYLMSQLG